MQNYTNCEVVKTDIQSDQICSIVIHYMDTTLQLQLPKWFICILWYGKIRISYHTILLKICWKLDVTLPLPRFWILKCGLKTHVAYEPLLHLRGLEGLSLPFEKVIISVCLFNKEKKLCNRYIHSSSCPASFNHLQLCVITVLCIHQVT